MWAQQQAGQHQGAFLYPAALSSQLSPAPFQPPKRLMEGEGPLVGESSDTPILQGGSAGWAAAGGCKGVGRFCPSAALGRGLPTQELSKATGSLWWPRAAFCTAIPCFILETGRQGGLMSWMGIQDSYRSLISFVSHCFYLQLIYNCKFDFTGPL